MQRVFLLRSIFMEESGIGLGIGKSDDDGITTQPHAHTGADRTAVGSVEVVPVLRGAVVAIGIGVCARDILNNLRNPLPEELSDSGADAVHVDVFTVASHGGEKSLVVNVGRSTCSVSCN